MSSIIDSQLLPLYTGSDNVPGPTGHDCSATAGDVLCLGGPGGLGKFYLTRVAFTVTSAMTASGVIKVWNGTIAGASLIATLTLGATAAGVTVYKDVTVTLDPDDFVTFELDAVDTTTGKGFCSAVGRLVEEQPGNMSTLVVTA